MSDPLPSASIHGFESESRLEKAASLEESCTRRHSLDRVNANNKNLPRGEPRFEQCSSTAGEDLLHLIFPSHVAEKLKSHKVIPPEHFKNVSVLFADVVSYTTIVSRLTPLQTHALLNDLYNAIDALLSCFPCLYKVETIGDGVLRAACCVCCACAVYSPPLLPPFSNNDYEWRTRQQRR